MSDAPSSHNSGDNVPVFSVTEVSGLVKSTVEGAFQRVRIRGEISGFKRAASGHLYLCLKDDNAVIDAYVRALETQIAAYPSEWLWAYRRWKYDRTVDAVRNRRHRLRI